MDRITQTKRLSQRLSERFSKPLSTSRVRHPGCIQVVNRHGTPTPDEVRKVHQKGGVQSPLAGRPNCELLQCKHRRAQSHGHAAKQEPRSRLHDWSKPMNTLTSSNIDVQVAGLTAADHSLGSADAPVTLLEYGDYECPACAQVEPLTRHLVDTLGENIRFVFRHFPLVEVHPNAELAAEAAEAAAAQGRFWEMHRLLFSTPHHLALADLTKHAEAIGLDMTRFHAEMADHIYTQRVQEHRRAGELTHLRATPAFLINGKVVDVSFGLDKLEEAVHALTGAVAT